MIVDALPVVQHVEVCADAPRIAAAMAEHVQLAIARGVSVRVELARAGRGTEARATIGLPDGNTEDRVFSSSTRACVPLAHALGAWVSVRMDEWSERKKADAPPVVAAPPSPPPPAPVESPLPVSTGLDSSYDVDRDGRRIADLSGHEISVGSSLVGNLARHTLLGITGAAAFAVGDTIVLRASGFGYSAAVKTAAMFGARVDACRRVPGRYARTRGLMLDLCGGAEGGILDGWGYGAFGPAVIIHGDLSRTLSLDLGGGFNVPVGHAVHRADEGLVVALRGDLGVSWRLP